MKINITFNLYEVNTFGLPKQEQKQVQYHKLNDKVVKKMVDDVASEAADEMAVFLDKLYETSKQFIDMDNLV